MKPQQPDTLDSLSDAFNERHLTADDLARRSIPLLEHRRLQEMLAIMCRLDANNPGRYHHDNRDALWNDAGKIYAAKVDVFLLLHPKVKEKLVASSKPPGIHPLDHCP